MPAYRAKTDEEQISNELLSSIVLSLGGTITSGDVVSLLESWLAALGN